MYISWTVISEIVFGMVHGQHTMDSQKSLIYQFIRHWNFLTLGDTTERGDRG